MWTVVAASVTGSKHTDGANQDAYGFVPDSGSGERVRVAVADGHGASAYERSAKGAQLAVRAALFEDLDSAHDASPEGIMRGCVLRWRDSVEADLEESPHSMGREAYGTTLIVVSADQDTVACAQIGDGRVLVVDRTGDVSSPLPEDPRLVGNVTTSLAGANPMSDARFSRIPADGVHVALVCSDGYENSFAGEEAFFQAATDFADIVDTHGLGVVRAELRGWLTETMAGGSGDDTTVALVVRER